MPLPPEPSSSSLVQTLRWAFRPLPFMEDCRRQLGDSFSVRFLGFERPMVLISDPAAIKALYKERSHGLPPGRNIILEPILGPRSLLIQEGAEHLSRRKLMLPPFHGERMKGYERTMSEIAAREIDSWPVGSPCKLRPRMQAITLEIIIETVFGVRERERMGPLRAALREFLDLTTDPRFLLPVVLAGPERVRRVPGFARRIDRVDELIGAEIAARRAASGLAEREDILSLLVAAEHEDGSRMSDGEIRDELLTLLVAGHETTATALSWAVERLVRHPEKLARLRAEVTAGEDAYLTATIQETLRLRPVLVGVIRKLTEPVAIGGYELPAGVSVVPSIHLIDRDPRIYPEPGRFLPERFLGEGPGTYTWIPFGGGIRRCLGAAFAQFEMAVVLRELVKRRELSPARPQAERSFRRAITETPRHDAEVVLS